MHLYSVSFYRPLDGIQSIRILEIEIVLLLYKGESLWHWVIPPIASPQVYSICYVAMWCVTVATFLLCVVAIPPVSPTFSKPDSGAAKSPSPVHVETATVNTRGRYQFELCTGLLYN